MPQIKDVAITKTAAGDGDFLIMQNPITGETYRITKANLLSNFSGENNGGSTTTDPYFKDVMLLLHGNLADIKGHTINILGNTAVTSSQSKFDSDSIYFDGSEDRLAVSGSDLVINTEDFSIEFFLYWQQTNFVNEPGIFQISSQVGGLQPGYNNSLGILTSQSNYFLSINNIYYNTGVPVIPSEWIYFGLKREVRLISGINKKITSFWMGGVEKFSIEDNTNYIGNNLCIGGFYSPAYLGNMYIDEFRITKVARDLSKIPTVKFLDS